MIIAVVEQEGTGCCVLHSAVVATHSNLFAPAKKVINSILLAHY